ncbi:Rsp5p-dependent ubiquitination, sorting of cargo proteins at the multivesicular body [Nowakowskiella sp. JEL0407]|nr:Rsp5p-dependent ubiquitination, sorting of cargo proteins at the multivesicular body [Nowakowskiella sp. JEL0407]
MSTSGIPILATEETNNEALFRAYYQYEQFKRDLSEGYSFTFNSTDMRISVWNQTAKFTKNPESSRDSFDAQFPEVRSVNVTFNNNTKTITNVIVPAIESFQKPYSVRDVTPPITMEYILGDALREYTALTLDDYFTSELQAAYDNSVQKGLWKDTLFTASPHSRRAYWNTGVKVWFGCSTTPSSMGSIPLNRISLLQYDPLLWALLHRVFERGTANAAMVCPLMDAAVCDYGYVTNPPSAYACPEKYIIKAGVFVPLYIPSITNDSQGPGKTIATIIGTVIVVLIILFGIYYFLARRASRREDHYRGYEDHLRERSPLWQQFNGLKYLFVPSQRQSWVKLDEMGQKQFGDEMYYNMQHEPAHNIDPYYFESMTPTPFDPIESRRSSSIRRTGGRMGSMKRSPGSLRRSNAGTPAPFSTGGAGPSRIVEELGKIIEVNGAKTNQLQRLFHLRGVTLLDGELDAIFDNGECSTVRSKWPLTRISPDDVDVCYFEVTIVKIHETCKIAIGLSEAFRHQDAMLPGYTHGSISLSSDGTLHLGSEEAVTEENSRNSFADPNLPPESAKTCYGSRPWQEGDVIGCGYHPFSGETVFTLNGEVLGIIPTPTNIETRSLVTPNRRDLFAVIGAETKSETFGCRVKLNFGMQEFLLEEANPEMGEYDEAVLGEYDYDDDRNVGGYIGHSNPLRGGEDDGKGEYATVDVGDAVFSEQVTREKDEVYFNSEIVSDAFEEVKGNDEEMGKGSNPFV